MFKFPMFGYWFSWPYISGGVNSLFSIVRMKFNADVYKNAMRIFLLIISTTYLELASIYFGQKIAVIRHIVADVISIRIKC